MGGEGDAAGDGSGIGQAKHPVTVTQPEASGDGNRRKHPVRAIQPKASGDGDPAESIR